jgi:hypothetical protein
VLCKEGEQAKEGANYGRGFYAADCGNKGFCWKNQLKKGQIIKCKAEPNEYHYVVQCADFAEVDKWRTFASFVQKNNLDISVLTDKIEDMLQNEEDMEQAVLEEQYRRYQQHDKDFDDQEEDKLFEDYSFGHPTDTGVLTQDKVEDI